MAYQNGSNRSGNKKPRPADNLKKYQIKHIPKNKDISENSWYKSKQDKYTRL